MIREIVPLPIRRALGGRWHAWQAARAKARLLRRLAGDAVECNVCGWKGCAFTSDSWHEGTICPNCRSQVRHRMLAAALDGHSLLPGLEEASLLAGRRVLHFAPERQLRERFARAAAQYLTADFARGDCDLQLDISNMRQISGAAFDTLIACDVLEHVPDDRAALREIARVLSPQGIAILTVPQKDPPATTDEDPSVTSEAGREARFGQKDHVRMYGVDFVSRLEEAVFAVTTLTGQDFPPRVGARHVLAPPRPNPHPLSTNFRRIFFARPQPGTSSR
ncbi:MAG: class I SAM-dependent methyltransferase [Terrimicrobiaceae bacterium]|nr:class I SAM-dependent methyltransferase [Terrimicrobiaceae bacterium]